MGTRDAPATGHAVVASGAVAVVRGSQPLEIPIADLLREPGSRRAVRCEAVLGDLGTTTASVAGDATVVAEVALEVIGSSLVVEGAIHVPWSGACRRCLDEVSGVLEVTVREIFDRSPVEGETYPLGDDHVDLAPMVRDATLGALPLAPLCSPDCRGPDPGRFPARPAATDPVADPPVAGPGGRDAAPGDGPRPAATRDPRWAALDDVRFDD